MRFTISAAAFLAFAANVLAQNPNFDPVNKPTPNEKINAGTTYTIEWTAPDAFKDVTVSISLIGGATQGGQVPLLDIASGVPNSAGKYSWTIPSTLGKDAFYGLTIKSEANPSVDFQYSNPFHIVAGESSSGTTTLTSSSGTATVTLSAASVSATSSASVSAAASSSDVVIVNSTTALSTTAAPTAVTSAPATVITSVTKPAGNGTATKSGSGSGSPSTTLATVTAPGAGAQATAGVFAVLGGLAVAALL
ncbi:extracellular serine-threonine rich protein [Colletotrichum karsti]|uniref:Extracellular serine-threonine rich protein n=1 Tax=Colletotrichum karsti TaxID=1095194 RepID=A0A9P6IC87_9PEZI|nr:extracellular serine-threonine rich protein [Colletotrichum karsti]KAF9879834.1 extracellular serine-threonine rich protein [Colletotrichum karsti]